ncbi:MAG: hypothetical protein A4E55_02460 [Pelotomaculum sp. PtaU1.Bin035]|nr:MAG: hypothetical protein A4E55_02460 [Pelotomaculum sp. PtaU1.Bin035]
MFSPEQFDGLLEQIISQLGQGKVNSQDTHTNSGCCVGKKKPPVLTPQKVLVILGLIRGVLEVRSVLIDRNQSIEILLDGSLRRRTRLDKILDEIGNMPFDDVLRSLLGRLS